MSRTSPVAPQRFLLALVLGAVLVVVGPHVTGRAFAYSGPALGSTPVGTPVPLLEYVNDDVNGHTWNAYDHTQDIDGPQIYGRASAVNTSPGVMQVFTVSSTDDLIDWVNDGRSGRVWNAYDLTQSTGSGTQIVGSPTAVLVGGVVYAFAEDSSHDLIEYASDHQGGYIWNANDLSVSASGGSDINGDPTAVEDNGTTRVFVGSYGGDLVEYSSSGASWSATDLSEEAGGGTVSSDPAAVVSGSVVHVYVASWSGNLVQYADDGTHGHTWSATDLSEEAGGGTQVSGDPAAILYGSGVHVYVRSNDGDLVEYVNDGADGHTWNAYDQTLGAGGGVQIAGDPSAVVYGPVVHVYVRSNADHLVEFTNDGADGHIWNTYDQSVWAGGGGLVGSDPTAVLYGGTQVHVYVGGPDPALAGDVVALAESQDQYNGKVEENPPNSNCNGYTGYFGRGSATGCVPGTRTEEWCSDFADWVWTLNGIDTRGITGYSFTFVSWGMSHGTFSPGATNDPLPGDALVWGDVSTGYGAHVGLVAGVKDGEIEVVSGNSGTSDGNGGVTESGFFDPSTSTISGYPIVGYIAP